MRKAFPPIYTVVVYNTYRTTYVSHTHKHTVHNTVITYIFNLLNFRPKTEKQNTRITNNFISLSLTLSPRVCLFSLNSHTRKINKSIEPNILHNVNQAFV